MRSPLAPKITSVQAGTLMGPPLNQLVAQKPGVLAPHDTTPFDMIPGRLTRERFLSYRSNETGYAGDGVP